jgi:hypothetical protein
MTSPSNIHGECKLRQNHAGLRWVAYTKTHTQNRIHNKKTFGNQRIYIYMVPSKIKEWIQLLHKINEHLKLSFEHPRECKKFHRNQKNHAWFIRTSGTCNFLSKLHNQRNNNVMLSQMRDARRFQSHSWNLKRWEAELNPIFRTLQLSGTSTWTPCF